MDVGFAVGLVHEIVVHVDLAVDVDFEGHIVFVGVVAVNFGVACPVENGAGVWFEYRMCDANV